MKKPVSIPSDGNQRRLVKESFTVTWTVRGVQHRATIPAWGSSYEPSVPRLYPALNFLMLFVAWPMALYYGWAWLMGVAGAWTAIMTPAILMGVLAPREALSPVSAAHDYFYTRQGRLPGGTHEIKVEGTWQSTGPLSRLEADAVMRADPDDPLWLRWGAWLFVRLVGWWKWHRCWSKIKNTLS